MTELDVAWLAGLLEGEGCFSYGSSPTIKVGMTDQDIVERVATLFGRHVRGPYQYAANKKPVFYTEVHGLPAIEIMRVILPYMGQRRTSKINESLERHAAAPGKSWKTGTGRTAECHPNSRHYANGMCKSCYKKDRYAKGLVP